MPLSSNPETFLTLVRQGIGRGADFLPKTVDWREVKDLADAHGLSAVVLDGIDALQVSGFKFYVPLPLELKLEWIGEVLQNYEQRYNAYKNSISDLARFYNQHGFKMMVIKGYGLSLNYPKPSHRPCGDIDVWLFGQQREADAALAASSKFQDSGFKIDTSHHHHTVFEWEGFTVENHYDFMNVHYGHRSKELEKIFKELGNLKVESSEFRVECLLNECNDAGCKFPIVEVNGEKVYLPSANLHALFLLRHSLQDFAAAVLTLRQVLDWALFVEKHGKEIDWVWLTGIVNEYKMTDFFNCLNAICVGDLGFDVKIFPNVQFDPFLKEKVLDDIISPAYKRQSPRGFLKGMIYKYRRWQGNAWKQELCYHDSRWSAFWSGVWNHLLKPKTI